MDIPEKQEKHKEYYSGYSWKEYHMAGKGPGRVVCLFALLAFLSGWNLDCGEWVEPWSKLEWVGRNGELLRDMQFAFSVFHPESGSFREINSWDILIGSYFFVSDKIRWLVDCYCFSVFLCFVVFAEESQLSWVCPRLRWRHLAMWVVSLDRLRLRTLVYVFWLVWWSVTEFGCAHHCVLCCASSCHFSTRSKACLKK